MTPHHPVSFFLREDFHEELGWEQFVRECATQDPEIIRQIIPQAGRLGLGPDPLGRLERWAPWLRGFMFYFWCARPGDYTASFVATDGAFSMMLTPLPEDEHLLGLPDELEAQALAAWPEWVRPVRSPLMPQWPGPGPAPAVVLPDWIIVHRYPVSRATLLPGPATLRQLAADPWAWWRAQPPLPGLYRPPSSP